MVQPLAEHGRRDERDALFRDVETLAVLVGVDPGAQPGRDLRALVDDDARKDRAAYRPMRPGRTDGRARRIPARTVRGTMRS